MKIAFIQNGAYEKLGVHQLSGCLKNADKNIEVDIFIQELEPNFYDKIVEFKPDFVLYSLFIGEESFMMEAFTKIKELLPDTKTIVGGPFTLVFPEVVQKKQVDFIIRGDGEYSLPLFFELYKAKKSLKDVPGICFIQEDGTIFKNDNIRLTSDLKNIPDPDRDLYYKYEHLRDKDTKSFIASRGCPYNCTYCYNAELKKFYTESYWRLRESESVFKEIEYVKNKYGLKWIHFEDGTFNSNIEWLKSFLAEYKKRNLPPFLCNCRVENITEELVSLMKDAGCDRITFGIQSGNEYVRKDISGRNMPNQQIEWAFKLCQKYNIRVGADIIFGWPGETMEQAMDTINLCRKLKADTYHSNVLITYPRLWITKRAIKEGFLQHEPTFKEIRELDSNKSLIKQKNIKLLINMDKLFNYFIQFPFMERFLKLLLHLPPNRFFKFLKNLHLLRRSLKYDSNGFISFSKLINKYIKDNI
jgi:radical SAM superfamily enzyme YgiQ (UPF0313 family)